MKHLLRRVLSWPLRLLPAAFRRRLTQAITTAAAMRAPADAMRELLQIESDLSGAIDELALAYGDGVHVKHRLMRYHDFFVERIGAGERVLDVGCGYGAVAYSVASRAGAHVTGIDLSESNISEAMRRFNHRALEFVRGTAPRDVPARGFDVILASNVLEHIEHRLEFLAAIQERTRAARWLIRVPMANRDWRVPLRAELGLFAFSDPTHFIEYTRETFEQEIREAGFEVAHLQVNWGEIWSEVRPRA
jgi:2-polyprenyl-3-methyl-5-hydroxy-6-metoxy-1,4-benzoquinol methylase